MYQIIKHITAFDELQTEIWIRGGIDHIIRKLASESVAIMADDDVMVRE